MRLKKSSNSGGNKQKECFVVSANHPYAELSMEGSLHWEYFHRRLARTSRKKDRRRAKTDPTAQARQVAAQIAEHARRNASPNHSSLLHIRQ